MKAGVGWLLLTGMLTQAPAAPVKPYDIRALKLGTLSTIVIALESDCKPCFDSIEFYKRLMNLPGMDGSKRRVVVVAMDGVWPVKKRTDALSFKPHRLTSGPYPGRDLPGVKAAPTILVFDRAGKQRGVWTGPFTPVQQKAVIAAATAR
ncbi:MAG: hypothetical protein WD690_01650 [Vicinamibacterales bacterium]